MGQTGVSEPLFVCIFHTEYLKSVLIAFYERIMRKFMLSAVAATRAVNAVIGSHTVRQI